MGQLYFYPPDGEDPSPMYEGLRTNLPYVSSTQATGAGHKQIPPASFPLPIRSPIRGEERLAESALPTLSVLICPCPGCHAVPRTRVSAQHGRISR